MSEVATPERAKFKAMTEGTQEDWMHIAVAQIEFRKTLVNRVLDHLQLLKGDFGGFPIDRLEHCLQTATRAAEDGRDEEYVACALLHDIGDPLAPYNHTDLAAAVVKPFVSEKNHWMVEHHGIFQGYYFFHFIGTDRNMRDRFKGHEYYDYTEEFCHKYDQTAFDPDYKSMSLESFTPLLERFFAEPKNTIYPTDAE